MAPLLSDRVTLTEAEIYRSVFATCQLDETFLFLLHSRICAGLIPEWAGKWRTVEVRVGNLKPVPPSQVPVMMRDYGRDLQARWPDASNRTSEITLEFLAFAEGRFLTVHPFPDFNGRTVRLFLLELLRRLDLPKVELASGKEKERSNYFKALEAADANNWDPLMDIWRDRLAFAETL